MKGEINLDVQDMAKHIADEVVKIVKPLIKKDEEVLFTVKTLAKYLNVGTSWIYAMREDNKIPYIYIEGIKGAERKTIRFKKTAIDKWLEENKVPVVPDIKKGA